MVDKQPLESAKDGGGLEHLVPLTIRAYWVWSATIATSAAAVGASEGRFAGSILILGLVIAMATFVYHRSTVAWSLLVGTPVVRIALLPFATQPGWLILIEILSVLFLVAPQSVRFIWQGRHVGPGRGGISAPDLELADGTHSQQPRQALALDPSSYEDSRRPAGWYINPESPGRMRYWSGDGNWTGDAKTPRALLKQWHNLNSEVGG